MHSETPAIEILICPSWISEPSRAIWPEVCNALDSRGVDLLPGHGLCVWLLCDAVTRYIRISELLKECQCPTARGILSERRASSWACVTRACEACCLSVGDLVDHVDGFVAMETPWDRTRRINLN